MSTNFRVPMRGSLGKSVLVNNKAANDTASAAATAQAAAEAAQAAAEAAAAAGSLANQTTDNLNEGQFNLYFTDLRAQDAVGSILAETASIDLVYVAGTSIKANLNDVTLTSGGTLALLGFDAQGRLSETAAASTTNLPEGTNLYFTADRVYLTNKADFIPGSGVTISYDDSLQQITFSSTGGTPGGMIYSGTWDASTGSPPSIAPVNGQYWVVSVAGTTNLSGITDWQIHDWAVYNGIAWEQIQNDRVGLMLSANNLSDVANPATSLANLGQTKSANTFWGGPTSGSAAAPTWRVLSSADTPFAQPVASRSSSALSSPSGTPVQSTIAIARAFDVFNITATQPCRVRLYSTVAHQAADFSRLVTTYPGPFSGLLLEAILTATNLTLDFPMVNVFNNESTVTTAIAYSLEPANPVATTATLNYIIKQA